MLFVLFSKSVWVDAPTGNKAALFPWLSRQPAPLAMPIAFLLAYVMSKSDASVRAGRGNRAFEDQYVHVPRRVTERHPPLAITDRFPLENPAANLPWVFVPENTEDRGEMRFAFSKFDPVGGVDEKSDSANQQQNAEDAGKRFHRFKTNLRNHHGNPIFHRVFRLYGGRAARFAAQHHPPSGYAACRFPSWPGTPSSQDRSSSAM